MNSDTSALRKSGLISPATVVNVRPFSEDDAPKWDAFVAECPGATFFHRTGWKRVIEEVFGHATHYLVAEADGAIEGVIALGHIRSRLFGNALISCPFAVYGGAAAVTDRARRGLEEAALDLAKNLGVDYLELRNRHPSSAAGATKDLYVTFRKALSPDHEENMRAIPRKQRAMVRKGLKSDLVATIDDGVDRLFRAYSTSVRNLGTPVFAKRYFRVLKDVFGDDCEILTVTKDGRTVSSVMSFYFRDEVLPYYGGGTEEARKWKANDLMYWEVMRRAVERGVRTFDYGRSKVGTGSYSFKKNWGFEPEPLPYHYQLVKAREVPNVSPLNPKYQLFIKAWKHLPLWAANTVGPWLSRNLG
ncbi:MAG: FemAB family PEP-CTERM system-associated protein [Gammaproteobacteria bacterium]